MTSPHLPARIDRATFERVLQRAAELQAVSRDIGEGLTEDEVIALGHEVGIPEVQLRQALLEERTRVAPHVNEGWLDHALAPADFQADRVVQGNEADVARALTTLLDREEHFTVQRAIPGRITFEPLDALAAGMRALKRVFNTSAGRRYLDKAQLVTAVITPLEPGFCHVALSASVRKSRTGYVAGGAVVGGIGVVMSAGLVMLVGSTGGQLLALLPGMAGALGGLATARAYLPIAERTGLGLARLLDQLERQHNASGGRLPAEPKSRVIAREVGSVVREITTEVRKALEEK